VIALNFPTGVNIVIREASVHAIAMIKTFQHKGLKAYFESGTTKGDSGRSRQATRTDPRSAWYRCDSGRT